MHVRQVSPAARYSFLAAWLSLNSSPCHLARSNRPIASKRKESHQRKYPILRADLSDPKRTNQCALVMNAVAATHADARNSERDPRSTTHGEPNRKSSVVTEL